jgi:membrane dipeptidase
MTRILQPTAFLLLAVAACAPAPAPDGSSIDRARRILTEVPLIDGHNDLPWEVRRKYDLDWDRLDIAEPQPQLMTDIPRLRAGGVGAVFWSTYSPSSFEGRIAARAGFEENDVVHRMIARYPETFELALTAADIERIFADGKIGSLIGLEGGHMIENSLGLLRAFFRDGVRYMTLTHSRNTDWADAATDDAEHDGLTAFGEEVVREMNRLGMMVDISHASDATMMDVLRVTEAPVIYSHSSSRHFTPHRRNVPDEIAAMTADNGGLIMVNYVASFTYLPAWERSQRRRAHEDALELRFDEATVEDSLDAWDEANPVIPSTLSVIADHIEHLRDVAGVDHVGIGSDLDGIDTPPEGLEDASTFPALVAELLDRGWNEEDVKKVVGLNALRVMRAVEATAARLQQERSPSVAQIEVVDGWTTEPPWEQP